MALSQSKFKKEPVTESDTEKLIEAINLGLENAVVSMLEKFKDNKAVIKVNSAQIKIAVAIDDMPSLLKKFDKAGILRLSQFETINVVTVLNAINLNAIIAEAMDFKRDLETGSLRNQIVVIKLENDKEDQIRIHQQQSIYEMVKYLINEGLYEKLTSDTLLKLSSTYKPEVKAIMSDYLLNIKASQDLADFNEISLRSGNRARI